MKDGKLKVREAYSNVSVTCNYLIVVMMSRCLVDDDDDDDDELERWGKDREGSRKVCWTVMC